MLKIDDSCGHDISDQDAAVQAYGLCPLCLASDVDRLRTALKKIAGPDPESTLDEPDLDCEVVVKLRAIARAALSNGERG